MLILEQEQHGWETKEELYEEMRFRTKQISDALFIRQEIDIDTHNKKQKEITDWYCKELRDLFSKNR